MPFCSTNQDIIFLLLTFCAIAIWFVAIFIFSIVIFVTCACYSPILKFIAIFPTVTFITFVIIIMPAFFVSRSSFIFANGFICRLWQIVIISIYKSCALMSWVSFIYIYELRYMMWQLIVVSLMLWGIRWTIFHCIIVRISPGRYKWRICGWFWWNFMTLI